MQYTAFTALDLFFKRTDTAFFPAPVQNQTDAPADHLVSGFSGSAEGRMVGIDNDAVSGGDQRRVLNGGENVFPLGDGTVILLVGGQPVGDIEAEQHHAHRSLVDVGFNRAVPVYCSQISIFGAEGSPETEISSVCFQQSGDDILIVQTVLRREQDIYPIAVQHIVLVMAGHFLGLGIETQNFSAGCYRHHQSLD